MIKPERLVIDPEFLAIARVEPAHLLKTLQGTLDVKSDADFLGPFTPYRLIERFAIFDTAAGQFRHVGRTSLRGKHYCIFMNSDDQRKYTAARLDN